MNGVEAKVASMMGRRVRAELEALERRPDDRRSLEQFAEVMDRLDRRAMRERAWRKIVQVLSAIVAALTGAGAYRLLTR